MKGYFTHWALAISWQKSCLFPMVNYFCDTNR